MSGPYDPHGPSRPPGSSDQGPSQDPSTSGWRSGSPSGQWQSGGWQPGASGDRMPPYGQPQPFAPGQQGQMGGYPGETEAWGPPTAPSQPPYGYPGGPSRPWQSFQEQSSAPTWGMPSQSLAGPGQPFTMPPAAPRKSRRKLWIALGIVAALIVAAGSGGAFAFAQYIAPATAVGALCGQLKTQDYTAAYGELSAGLRSQFSRDEFTQAGQTLDKIEGQVTACGEAKVANPYSYSLGSSTAQVVVVFRRASAGSLQGTIALKSEGGAWKIASLDSSLLGVNLGTLSAAGSFCRALQAQNYTAAYAVLGSAPRLKLTQDAFTQAAQLHDQVDGSVSACALVGIAAGAGDSSASLTVSVTRAKLGARQGTVGLQVENSAWKIDSLVDTLLGTDVGPIQVGNRFCTDLANANYADAFNLLSANGKGGSSEADFASSIALPSPLKWGTCTPDVSTYKVSGTTASYTAGFGVVNTSTNQSVSVNFTLSFVNTGGTWQLDDLTKA
jgi:hypothetical protein